MRAVYQTQGSQLMREQVWIVGQRTKTATPLSNQSHPFMLPYKFIKMKDRLFASHPLYALDSYSPPIQPEFDYSRRQTTFSTNMPKGCLLDYTLHDATCMNNLVTEYM